MPPGLLLIRLDSSPRGRLTGRRTKTISSEGSCPVLLSYRTSDRTRCRRLGTTGSQPPLTRRTEIKTHLRARLVAGSEVGWAAGQRPLAASGYIPSQPASPVISGIPTLSWVHLRVPRQGGRTGTQSSKRFPASVPLPVHKHSIRPGCAAISDES